MKLCFRKMLRRMKSDQRWKILFEVGSQVLKTETGSKVEKNIYKQMEAT